MRHSYILLGTFGYPALAVTTLARYQTLGRQKLVASFFAAARRDGLIAGCLVLSLVIAFFFITGSEPGHWTALFYGGLAAPAYAVMRLNNFAANSLRRFTLSYVPDFVGRSILLFAFIAIMSVLFPGFGIEWVLGAFVAILWSVTLFQGLLLGRHGATAALSITPRRVLGVIYRRRAGALVVVSLATVAFADIVTLIGGLFLPPAEVAVLGIAIRLAALTGFITQASQQFVMRDLTSALARGVRGDVDSLLKRTNLLALGVMLLAIACAIVLGDEALSLFGAEYQAGHWPLVIFLASQTIRAAGGMNVHLLSLQGHQLRLAQACIASLAIIVAASAVLAPLYGVTGIAIAVLLGDAIWALWIALLAQHLTGRRGDVLGGIHFRLFRPSVS